MVLLGLHNPFGDYEYYSRGVNDRWIEINSPLEYTSMNTLFDWIKTPSEVIGFLIPVIIFGVVWIYIFKDNEQAPKESE